MTALTLYYIAAVVFAVDAGLICMDIIEWLDSPKGGKHHD